MIFCRKINRLISIFFFLSILIVLPAYSNDNISVKLESNSKDLEYLYFVNENGPIKYKILSNKANKKVLSLEVYNITKNNFENKIDDSLLIKEIRFSNLEVDQSILKGFRVDFYLKREVETVTNIFDEGKVLSVKLKAYNKAKNILVHNSLKLEKEPISLLIPSSNFSDRPKNTKIKSIIIHHTGSNFYSPRQDSYFFQIPNARVSAHYTIGKNGLIVKNLLHKNRGWHAGRSSWLGDYNVNNYSIGIEIVNKGNNKDVFTKKQYESLSDLSAYLIKKFKIPLKNITGHRHIALPVAIKADPADNFDWKSYRKELCLRLGQNNNSCNKNYLPEQNYISLKVLRRDLISTNLKRRLKAINMLLNFNLITQKKLLNSLLLKETNLTSIASYFRVIRFNYNKDEINYAKKVLDKIKKSNYSTFIFEEIVRYIYFVEKKNSFNYLFDLYKYKSSNNLKLAILQVLGNFSNNKTEIIGYLLKDLKSTYNGSKRVEIIYTLSEFKDKSLKKYFLYYLKNNFSYEVKKAAISGLLNNYDLEIENNLLKFSKTKAIRPETLNKISELFTRKFSSRGVFLLTRKNIFYKLSDKNKIALISVIGKLKSPLYETWLIETFKEESEMIKANILISLGRINGDKSLPFLVKNLDQKMSNNLKLTNYEAIAMVDLKKARELLKTESNISVRKKQRLILNKRY